MGDQILAASSRRPRRHNRRSTGLSAVMHKKPDQPEKKAPSFELLSDAGPQRKPLPK
jgi:hypothetical protein